MIGAFQCFSVKRNQNEAAPEEAGLGPKEPRGLVTVVEVNDDERDDELES